MFRVYYLGGAKYPAARRHLGISELTWADWAEEIRRLAGREFTRAGLFPPSRYFRVSSAQSAESDTKPTTAPEHLAQMVSAG